MDADNSPLATTIGTGMTLSTEGEVTILLLLGDVTDDGDRTLGVIPMDVGTAAVVTAKLQELLSEAQMVTEATSTMGAEAASEYLNNWVKRFSSPLN